jgi:hypothetical protein
VRRLTVQPLRADTDQQARHLQVRGIRQVLELLPERHKAGRRRDFAPPHPVRLALALLRDRGVQVLLGREAERHLAFLNAPAALVAARDKNL